MKFIRFQTRVYEFHPGTTTGEVWMNDTYRPTHVPSDGTRGFIDVSSGYHYYLTVRAQFDSAEEAARAPSVPTPAQQTLWFARKGYRTYACEFWPGLIVPGQRADYIARYFNEYDFYPDDRTLEQMKAEPQWIAGIPVLEGNAGCEVVHSHDLFATEQDTLNAIEGGLSESRRLR